jgi:hypothetical protein
MRDRPILPHAGAAPMFLKNALRFEKNPGIMALIEKQLIFLEKMPGPLYKRH